MAGQNGHFRVYAPTELPYAIERYTNEVHRLYGVMNTRRAGREFLAGAYSIADMACYPWIVTHKPQGQELDDFPHLKRWFGVIAARPARARHLRRRGRAVPARPSADHRGRAPAPVRTDRHRRKEQIEIVSAIEPHGLFPLSWISVRRCPAHQKPCSSRRSHRYCYRVFPDRPSRSR